MTSHSNPKDFAGELLSAPRTILTRHAQDTTWERYWELPVGEVLVTAVSDSRGGVIYITSSTVSRYEHWELWSDPQGNQRWEPRE